MTQCKHKKLRPLRLVSMALRGLAGLISLWPVLLLAGVLISPVGPHLRTQHSYERQGSYKRMVDCTYLGSRGWVRHKQGGKCPVITIIDRRVIH